MEFLAEFTLATIESLALRYVLNEKEISALLADQLSDIC